MKKAKFGIGGTADSSNTGAEIGGTMASSFMAKGGAVKMVYLNSKEDASYESAMEYYLNDGLSESKAEKMAIEDLKKEFPRLAKEFVGKYKISTEIKEMAKGGGTSDRKAKMKKIEAFLAEFPNNATSWGEATDEIRDMARTSKEFYNDIDLNLSNDDPKALKALNFRFISTPSDWNTKGKACIKSVLVKMSNQSFNEFYRKFSHWFDSKKEWGGTAESSETGLSIGGENQTSMYSKGGGSLSPKAERFLDMIRIADRSIQLKDVTVESSPKGNLVVYVKGKKLMTVSGSYLDEETIDNYGLRHYAKGGAFTEKDSFDLGAGDLAFITKTGERVKINHKIDNIKVSVKLKDGKEGVVYFSQLTPITLKSKKYVKGGGVEEEDTKKGFTYTIGGL